MQFKTEHRGQWLVLKLEDKRLDASKAVEFRETVNRFIDEGHRYLIFDISSIDFIDSSGLGALVACLKRLGQQGDIAIVGAKNAVRTMFKLTRMDKVFKLYDRVEEALGE